METNRAAENLQTIRTLMERSAVYRRALAPIMTFCGVTGIAGGIVGWQLRIDSSRSFVLFWTAAAIVALTGSFLLARRQALKDAEPFWSPPARRVVQALLPPLLVGACLGSFPLITQADGSELRAVLVVIWMMLYGCALLAASTFMTRGIKIFGWLCLAFASVLFCIYAFGIVDPFYIDANYIMGVFFGGLHFAYGIYLYFTEKRGNES